MEMLETSCKQKQLSSIVKRWGGFQDPKKVWHTQLSKGKHSRLIFGLNIQINIEIFDGIHSINVFNVDHVYSKYMPL